MQKIHLGLMGALVVALVALVFAFQRSDFRSSGYTEIYASDRYGITFAYPQTFFVAAETQGAGERERFTIVLAEDSPEHRAFFANSESASEPPPTIVVSIFQNDIDHYTARSFLEGTGFTNYKLSTGETKEVKVGGIKGLRYSATGLYENDNTVVTRDAYVYMFTVMYEGADDSIIDAYDGMLSTVTFTSVAPTLKSPTEPDAGSNTDDSSVLPDPSNIPTSADNAPEGSMHNLSVPPAVRAVKEKVANDVGVEEGLVIVMSVYERDWPDACLGLASSNEMCAQVITPGYEVTVRAGGSEYTYHTDSTGRVIRPAK